MEDAAAAERFPEGGFRVVEAGEPKQMDVRREQREHGSKGIRPLALYYINGARMDEDGVTLNAGRGQKGFSRPKRAGGAEDERKGGQQENAKGAAPPPFGADDGLLPA